MALKRYAELAEAFGLSGADDRAKTRALIDLLRGLNDQLNIPHCIQHYGADSYPADAGFVPVEVFEERKATIATNAIGDACTGANPIQPSQEQMEAVLSACYYDTEIDF